MSHLKEYNTSGGASDGRALGDEWADWDGNFDHVVREGKPLFMAVSAGVLVLADLLLCLLVYLIEPRLFSWSAVLPRFAWGVAVFFIVATAVLMAMLLITVFTGRNLFFAKRLAYIPFGLYFSNAFRLAGLLKISRDRVGHSFVRVSNALSYAMKENGRKEKLLILLPRCLAKEELKAINDLKNVYPLEVHTVSGGELARKKVKELRPTAVIGVACERDLVSGIRDVGQKLSVIGIPNQRPEGPCKNTHIDMKELVGAIEFYLGQPCVVARSVGDEANS